MKERSDLNDSRLPEILPVRDALELFSMAGVESSYVGYDMMTRMYHMDGLGGPCVMVEAEFLRFNELCQEWANAPRDLQDAPWISMMVVESEEEAGLVSELRVKPDDRQRIYRSLATTLREVQSLVASAQGNLSVEDYGDALRGAMDKLKLCSGCVDGLLATAAEIYPLKVWASGGSTGIHDWLMSDGSIKTMSCDEAAKLKPNTETADDDELEALDLWHKAEAETCVEDLLRGVPVHGGSASRNDLRNLILSAFLSGAVEQLTRPFVRGSENAGGPAA